MRKKYGILRSGCDKSRKKYMFQQKYNLKA